MTVREARAVLFGPSGELNIGVFFGSEEYDITEKSPVRTAFDNYIVEDISAPQPFKYKISLKQEYIMKEETT